MAFTVYVLNEDGDEYEKVGRYADGEVQDEELYEILPEEAWESRSEDRLVDTLSSSRVRITRE